MAADGQPSPSLPGSQQQPPSIGAAASPGRNWRGGSQLEVPASTAGRTVSVLITPPAPVGNATAGSSIGRHQHTTQQTEWQERRFTGVQPAPPALALPPQQQQHSARGVGGGLGRQPPARQQAHQPEPALRLHGCPPEAARQTVAHALYRIQAEHPRMPPVLCFVALEAAAFAAGNCSPEAAVAAAASSAAEAHHWQQVAMVANAQAGMQRGVLLQLVSLLLRRLQQDFLDGAEIRSMGGNTLSGVSMPGAVALPVAPAAEVRAALLQVCTHPQLAAPSSSDAATQVPPQPSPPTARASVMPEPAARWLAAGGLAHLHKSAMQHGFGALLRPMTAGMVVSVDVDFGVQQLVGQPGSTPGTNGSDAAGLQLGAAQHRQPGAVLLRPLRLQCIDQVGLRLIDITALPALEGTFAYLDDLGLAARALPTPALPARAERVRDAISDPVMCVSFRPGDEYVVTVAANCTAATDRRPASGVFQQLLILTLLVPASHATDAPLPCRWAVPGLPGYWAVVIGRRVTVALVDSLRIFDSMLSADAKVFVSAQLRGLFDTKTGQWQHAPDPFSGLLAGVQQQWPDAAPMSSDSRPAWMQSTIAAHRMAELQPLIGSRPSSAADETATRQHLQRLSRLLLLEEACMEVDVKRYDLFNVRVRAAAFAENGVTYRRREVWEGPGPASGEPTFTYRGPNLTLLARPDDNTWPELLVLTAPGILEGRPVLLPGDMLYIRSNACPDIEFGTRLLAADGTTCLLVPPPIFWQHVDRGRLGPSFWPRNVLFHVRFSFDRNPFRRMHAALCTATQEPVLRMLPVRSQHPTGQTSGMGSMPTVTAVTKVAGALREHGSRQLNSEQRQAVATLLCMPRNVIFCLNGPPGTGKTVTLVEAALQIFVSRPSSRLLLCAPQNYSADLIVSALAAAGVERGTMLRLNDPRRPPQQAKHDTLPFCLLDEAVRAFVLPSLQQISHARIVVASCSGAGLLREGVYAEHARQRPADGSFTDVLIDEAGQAIEPETLVPLTLLGPGGGSAMLCGDPRQLGPVVRSLHAQRGGLAASLLERLVAHHEQLAPQYATRNLAMPSSMLVRNYRSHQQLLELPSRMFYQSSLVAAASPDSVLAPRWNLLPATGQDQADGSTAPGEDAFDEDLLPASCLFYGVRGAQMREGEAPSYFNPVEAAVLVNLVAGLLQQHARSAVGVRPGDIGVIATYRKQVQKIRLLFRERGLGAIRVGTVDDYQGQEERIIFISTVLSRPETLPPAAAAPQQQQQQQQARQDDVHLGFWRNPKRFNVAITRAKALLVVVGHPVLLMEDASWRELVKFCAARDAYRGAGAEHMRSLLRAGGDSKDTLFGAGAKDAGQGEADGDISAAVQQIAEMALLGAGCADAMFPETLDEMYEHADELVFRVAL